MHYLQLSFSRTLGIVVIGFLSHFISTAQAQVAAPDSIAVDAPTRGLLFEIKSGKNTAYLFGSIHIAKADFYPMSPKVETAYKQADTVAVEVDVSSTQAMQGAMQKFSYVAPDKLQNHLTPATWESFKSTFGSTAEQMQGLKPFIAVSVLTLQAGMQKGFDPAQGIDLHFIQRAKMDKKALVELEGMAFQADILGGLSDQEGDALVASLVDSFKRGEFFNELDALATSWKAGDSEDIAKLFLTFGNKDDASRKIMKMLLDDRNEGMVAKINNMMKNDKKLFVVVGAGHLAGEKSVIDLLQKQGLEVKQIH